MRHYCFEYDVDNLWKSAKVLVNIRLVVLCKSVIKCKRCNCWLHDNINQLILHIYNFAYIVI